jgi:hypothetical protein
VKAIVRRTLLCTSLVALALPAEGGNALEARVYLSSAFAPSDVVITAFIEPDARNRVVEFVVDSGEFFSSSMAELDGDRAPRQKRVIYRRLPAGAYEIRVTLIGIDGERGIAVRRVALQ